MKGIDNEWIEGILDNTHLYELKKTIQHLVLLAKISFYILLSYHFQYNDFCKV